jgi:G3E family GTPase
MWKSAMELGKLIPVSVLAKPERAPQELMRSLVVRTNFVPAVRHQIGWRGLRVCSSRVDAWTGKIKDARGVFALYFDAIDDKTDWFGGRYTLGYFPDPEEELIESLSVRAIACTQQDDYFNLVRNFISFPDFAALFHIGAVQLDISRRQDAFRLRLETMTRQRTVATEGISITQEERKVNIVAPGSCDQDFPSYEVAIGFFKVLAASLGFCIEEAPVFICEARYEGTEISYDSSGNYWETPSEESDRVHVVLGYGKTNSSMEPADGEPLELNIWRTPDESTSYFRDPLWWNAHDLLNRNAVDQRLVGIDERPQLIVVTGFLGSGKTTFLQRFIEYQVSLSRFVAVIQNEIGETGLDGKLLDQDYALVEVDEGCICCSLAGNLKRAVRQILADFCPDYIVLETTGLANPLNLLDEIAELSDLVRFDSITTVVDGANVLTSLDSYEVALAQIKAADILLINKTDLLSEDSVEQVIARLKSINPVALTITTVQGDVGPSLLYGPLKNNIKGCMLTGEQGGIKSAGSLHVSHKHDCLSSVKIEFDEPLVRERFLERINKLPTQVFRIKGVIEFRGERGPKLFQSVAGRHDISEYKNRDFEERFLVCIGKNMESYISDPQSLRALLEGDTV